MTDIIEKDKFIVKKDDLNLWEYIGDLSQDILECSYNEDEIRELWVNGGLQEWIDRVQKEYPWRLKGYDFYKPNYINLLIALVSLAKGWTPGWGPDIVPLTPEEQKIVDTFNNKYEIIIEE